MFKSSSAAAAAGAGRRGGKEGDEGKGDRDHILLTKAKIFPTWLLQTTFANPCNRRKSHVLGLRTNMKQNHPNKNKIKPEKGNLPIISSFAEQNQPSLEKIT